MDIMKTDLTKNDSYIDMLGKSKVSGAILKVLGGISIALGCIGFLFIIWMILRLMDPKKFFQDLHYALYVLGSPFTFSKESVYLMFDERNKLLFFAIQNRILLTLGGVIVTLIGSWLRKVSAD